MKVTGLVDEVSINRGELTLKHRQKRLIGEPKLLEDLKKGMVVTVIAEPGLLTDKLKSVEGRGNVVPQNSSTCSTSNEVPKESAGSGLLPSAELPSNPIEAARLFKNEADSGLSQRKIADKYSVSRRQVGERLALLDLPEQVQELLSSGKITVSHGLQDYS